METIDEIFAAMPEEAAEAGREYLVIDPETRTITVPESERIFGVEADADAARKYFLCPRYVGDNLDLASMFLTVNYRNANGDEDGYLVEDVEIQGDYVTFSWQLWPKTVAYKGTLQFAVCADLPNTTHRRGPDWNTTLASGEVLEGLDPDRGDVEGETSDVVTQLRAEVSAQTAAVEATGAAQVQNVKNEGTAQVNTVKATGAQTEADALAAIKAQGEATLATIPAEYADLAAQVDKLTRERAAAIVCQAEGEVLQITDAGNDPLQGLRIFGKTMQQKTTGAQLIPYPYFNGNKTYNGITWNIHDDGSVDARGTATANSPLYFTNSAHELEPGQYTISGSAPGVAVRVDSTNRETGAWTTGVAISKNGAPVTFTITEEDAAKYTYTVYASVESGSTASATIYPMLNAGAVALPWEPYSGGVASPSPAWPQELQSAETPTVSVYGRNLMDWDKVLAALTASPADMTMETGDRRVVLSGTPTSNFWQCNDKLTEIPAAWRGRTMYLSATLAGTEPYLVMYIKDANNNSLPSPSLSATGVYEFVMPENAAYYLFAFCLNKKTVGAAVTAEYSNLHLGLTAEGGEAYKQVQELRIPTPGSLPGIPVDSGGNYTDAAGQQWICDEVDLARGVYVQRVTPYTVTGTEDWYLSAVQTGDTMRFDVNMSLEPGAGATDAVCAYFPSEGSNVAGVWCLVNEVHLALRVKWHYATLEEFKAFLTERYAANEPVVVYYALATPVETALTDAEIQAYLALQSYKPTTTVLNDAGAHMVLEYAADPKTYIDNKLAALIAANN